METGELRICKNAKINDFSENILKNYLETICQTNKNLVGLDNDEILRLQGIISDVYPTVIGINLFCDNPQIFFPKLCITAMRIYGNDPSIIDRNDNDWMDKEEIVGNIQKMLFRALNFVRRNTRVATIINCEGKRADRTEYPMDAVNELILNALIHRDYSEMSEDIPIRLMIFPDRIEVENPGELYGPFSVSDLGKVPGYKRNPMLAKNLEILIGSQNCCFGIPMIYDQMKKYGYLSPVFESRDGIFKATLYNQAVGTH